MYTVMFAVGVFLTLMGFPCHVITQSFTGSPGIIKCNDGDTVEMRWTLSSNFETGHEFFIFEDVTADPFDPNQVVFQSGHSTCIESNTRANCLFDIGNPAQIGFTLTGVTDSDARYYTCYWETFSVGGFYNSAALLYIYKSPSTPVISGVTMVRAGQKRQLSCSSTPQSLPLTESASSVIEYTWGSSLPITINGNTAEVGPVEKSDKGVEVTCTTNEQGSTFNAQSSIRVDVIWPSESSSLTANKMSVVEKIDNLELFCTIPIGSEGNPPPHQYRWKNSNSSDPVTLTTTNRLIITKESLSVESHHGLWECTPVNDAGHGVSATMFITVRAIWVYVGIGLGSGGGIVIIIVIIVCCCRAKNKRKQKSNEPPGPESVPPQYELDVKQYGPSRSQPPRPSYPYHPNSSGTSFQIPRPEYMANSNQRVYNPGDMNTNAHGNPVHDQFVGY